jgi:dihydrofolate reductase
MPKPFSVLGYAIVSEDGMIADSTGLMPQTLIFDSDKKFFERELDMTDAVVQGRNSYEYQTNSPNRRRLLMTRKVPALAPDPNFARGFLWNPAGASFEEACEALGLHEGRIGVLGGPAVYEYFFGVGFDAFLLTRAPHVRLPGGVAVFPQVGPDKTPEDVLAAHGLQAGPTEILDEADGLTLVTWTPRDGASPSSL